MPYDNEGKYIVGNLSIDPEKEMIRVKGSKNPDYLQVKHRMIMLRDMFREATHEEKIIFHDPDKRVAVVQATVTLPPQDINYPDIRAVGMGVKSETGSDFGDYLEKAATGAMGRALYAVGIGAQFSQYDMAYEEESEKDFVGVDSPVTTKAGTAPKKENLRTALKEATNKIGLDQIKQHVQDTYAVSSSAQLTDAQISEVIAWANQ